MAKRQIQTKGYGRIGGMLMLIAAVELLLFVLLAQHIYLNYSLSSNYISDLGVGSTAIIFNTSMELFGLLLVASSYFMHRAGYLYPSIALLIAGIGGFCVGIFPETAGILHIVSAVTAFGAVAIASISFSRAFKSYLSYYSAAAGLLALSILALFALNLSTGSSITFGFGSGGIEEILFYDEFIWASITGLFFAANRV
ncbi:MAG: DUF998 domain-containing protein [Candidatus Micrarchaeaceae archaeon]